MRRGPGTQAEGTACARAWRQRALATHGQGGEHQTWRPHSRSESESQLHPALETRFPCLENRDDEPMLFSGCSKLKEGASNMPSSALQNMRKHPVPILGAAGCQARVTVYPENRHRCSPQSRVLRLSWESAPPGLQTAERS